MPGLCSRRYSRDKYPERRVEGHFQRLKGRLKEWSLNALQAGGLQVSEWSRRSFRGGDVPEN